MKRFRSAMSLSIAGAFLAVACGGDAHQAADDATSDLVRDVLQFPEIDPQNDLQRDAVVVPDDEPLRDLHPDERPEVPEPQPDVSETRLDEAEPPEIVADTPDESPCRPQCTNRSCGDDGCGNACGTCPGNESCIEEEGRCSIEGRPCTGEGEECLSPSAGRCLESFCRLPERVCALRGVNCADGDQCTYDFCDPEIGCRHLCECDGCSDSDYCRAAGFDPCTIPTCVLTNSCVGTCSYPLKNCDDNDPCTEDSCEPTHGYCRNTFIPGCQHCNFDWECNPTDLCTEGVCDRTADPRGLCIWRPLQCDNGNRCNTGVCLSEDGSCEYSPIDCDDRKGCTADGCTVEDGCIHVLQADTCLIDGTCYAEGDAKGGEACQVCATSISTTGWSGVLDGTVCATASCDGLMWTTARTCMLGTCTGQGETQSCDDGKPCTTDRCEAATGCSHVLEAGTCLIGGTCYAEGNAKAGEACQVCATSSSTTGWSGALDGTVCASSSCDGLMWTAARTCMSGTCTGGGWMQPCDDGKSCTEDSCEDATGCFNAPEAGSCLINGTCYTEGDAKAGDACQVCATVSSATGWSNAANGLGCGTGRFCGSGQCQPEMVPVSGGTFWQGGNKDGSQCPTNGIDTLAIYRELPCHQVNVPTFWIDKYEVTVDAYGMCVADGGCTVPSTDNGGCDWGTIGMGSHPMNCITWTQAGTYCGWAGKRLCSESEWEKASRGTDGRIFPWGNETATCQYAVMWEAGNGCGTDRTMAVGSKPNGASPYGVLDMSGNVWEWVEDDLHYDYTGAPTNGSAWVDAPRASSRVIRGGSLDQWDTRFLRSSYRYSGRPVDHGWNLGVRCCKSL